MATPGLASRMASQSRTLTSPHELLAQVGTLSALGAVAEKEKNRAGIVLMETGWREKQHHHKYSKKRRNYADSENIIKAFANRVVNNFALHLHVSGTFFFCWIL